MPGAVRPLRLVFLVVFKLATGAADLLAAARSSAYSSVVNVTVPRGPPQFWLSERLTAVACEMLSRLHSRTKLMYTDSAHASSAQP